MEVVAGMVQSTSRGLHRCTSDKAHKVAHISKIIKTEKLQKRLNALMSMLKTNKPARGCAELT